MCAIQLVSQRTQQTQGPIRSSSLCIIVNDFGKKTRFSNSAGT